MNREFKISSEFNYLGEVPEFKELPCGYLIDKGKVGCGGTSVALENNIPTIVCVPFVELVKNKEAKYGGKVLGVYQGIEKHNIRDYVENYNGVKKIICTYDSLPKVMAVTGTEYFLLVDELHLLFTQYIFRDTAVRNVLDNFTKFRSWSFLTATPIEKDLMLEELKDIPTFKINWENNRIVNVKTIQCKQVAATVKNTITEYLEGKVFGNAHFFVNSVEFIANMVSKCGLTNDNCRVVFSKNNKNYKNRVAGINNSDTTTSPKKINFYTSTCFEGCDLFDKEGKIYIVSESNRAQTLLDISTQVRQIAGRIRDTKYWDSITHIYKGTRYNKDVTLEEFKEAALKTADEAKVYVERVNADAVINKGTKESIYPYVIKDEDKFIFDPNLIKLDIYNYKLSHHLYSLNVNIVDEYSQFGMTATNKIDKASDKLLRNERTRTTFEEAIKEYDEIMQRMNQPFNFSLTDDERLSLLKNKYSFIEDAYNLLGMDWIKELNYSTKDVKQWTILESTKMGNEVKVAKILKTMKFFKVGEFIPVSEVKKCLQSIYDSLGMNVKAKTSDIERYAEVKNVQKKIDGKNTKCLVFTYIKVK